ncbi:MAG TPA: hypothetical protein VEK15_31890 [Vicinamibacteria bacterium]|nr:hypothetical protein [Vicinamibacteria bacterium]
MGRLLLRRVHPWEGSRRLFRSALESTTWALCGRIHDAEWEAKLLDLLREASVARRFALADALTNTVISLSRRALAKQRPLESEREILLEWVGLHYGRDLEYELRDFFAQARSG